MYVRAHFISLSVAVSGLQYNYKLVICIHGSPLARLHTVVKYAVQGAALAEAAHEAGFQAPPT